MIRFRYSGAVWRVSDAVRIFGMQVESALPNRHPADGTIASGGHSKWPQSDHGADPNGIVRAIDVGESYGDAANDALAESLRVGRDSRLKYVISDRRMFSSYPVRGFPAWTWRPYSGSNPHASHIHLSVLDSADDDDGLWDLNLSGGSDVLTIEQLQEALIDAGHDPGPVDGIYGPQTKAAFVAGLTSGSVPGRAILSGDDIRIRGKIVALDD